ncbi:hypothetical protein MCUN1_000909 [Malassezia cuniculi]|uniref:Uncharacterized protein n=1 Tax=Malassezia cuniculi TaxID=948313 RepID=A0AAF0J529_9BASI|nr:hypothetical protein MCUN1_000909 [Malassezia cuniculi]
MVASFETIITDSGREGLAGVIGNVVDDVLQYNIADAGTVRQHRLVVALLCASANARKLPLRPSVVAQLLGELLACNTESSAAPLASLPLHVAAHVLRVLLRFGVATNEAVQQLVDHLTRETAFPFVDEGLFIIEYLLKHGDPHRALPLLAGMVSVDGSHIGEHVIHQARADGAAWERWASASPIRDRHTMSLRISLWTLCCRAWLRLGRTRRFQNAFSGLYDELQAADQRVGLPHPPSAELLRALYQMHVVNLAASGTPNSVRSAVHALARAKSYGITLTSTAVARVCNAALALDMPKEALAALLGTLDRQVLTCIGMPGIVAMMEGAVAENDTAAPRRIIGELGSDYDVPVPLRARFLAAAARAQLSHEAERLYGLWSESTGRMSETERTTLYRPWMHDTTPGARQMAGHLRGEPVTTTPRCVLALVRLFLRGSPEQQELARVVRDDYLRALYTLPLRTHEQLTALAQVSFLLGDTTGALHAMGEIIHRQDTVDMKDMAVLVGGIMSHSPDLALQSFFYLVRGDEAAGAEPVVPTPALYAVLIAKAIKVRRIDIALALHNDLVARGHAAGFAREAPHLQVSLSQLELPELVASITGMLREGWRPSSAHITWVIRCLLRGLRPIEALQGMPGRRPKPSHLAAAAHLYSRATAAASGTADLPTARLLLLRLAKLPDSVALVDKVVSVLEHAADYARRDELDKMMGTPSANSGIPPALVDLIVTTYTTLGDADAAHKASALGKI